MCFLTHGETQFHNNLISCTFSPITAYHSSIMIYCPIYTEDDCIHIPSTSYSISCQIYTSGKPLNMNSSTVTPNSSIVLKECMRLQLRYPGLNLTLCHLISDRTEMWPAAGTRVKNLYHIPLLSDRSPAACQIHRHWYDTLKQYLLWSWNQNRF